MKQLTTFIIAAVAIIIAGCNKYNQTTVSTKEHQALARTIGPIAFSGQLAWFSFGTREETEPGVWQCQTSYDHCQYQYIDNIAGHTVVSGEATGEIGYDGSTLIIALDKGSMTSTDVQGYYSRDGEFHYEAQGYYTTSGFDIKNVDDTDPNTIGDIHVDAGTYPVYEDENSILVVFDEP